MTRFLHKSKCFCYLLIVSLLVPTVASSSTLSADPIKVVNVRFEIVGTKIVVHYDLEGPLDRDYTVRIILKREHNQTYVHMPRSVVGEVGEGRFAGPSRQITWDVLKEFSQGLEGDDYYFVIEVELVSKGISPLWYIGGGVGVIGGVVGYLLSKGGAAAVSPAVEAFPKPIGRPAGN